MFGTDMAYTPPPPGPPESVKGKTHRLRKALVVLTVLGLAASLTGVVMYAGNQDSAHHHQAGAAATTTTPAATTTVTLSAATQAEIALAKCEGSLTSWTVWIAAAPEGVESNVGQEWESLWSNNSYANPLDMSTDEGLVRGEANLIYVDLSRGYSYTWMAGGVGPQIYNQCQSDVENGTTSWPASAVKYGMQQPVIYTNGKLEPSPDATGYDELYIDLLSAELAQATPVPAVPATTTVPASTTAPAAGTVPVTMTTPSTVLAEVRPPGLPSSITWGGFGTTALQGPFFKAPTAFVEVLKSFFPATGPNASYVTENYSFLSQDKASPRWYEYVVVGKTDFGIGVTRRTQTGWKISVAPTDNGPICASGPDAGSDLGAPYSVLTAFALDGGCLASTTVPGATTVPAATTTAPSASTVPVASTVPAATTAPGLFNTGLATYGGSRFSIEYPVAWFVNHISEGARNLDSTFQPSGTWSRSLIRVDEDPDSGETLAAASAPVITALNREPSYRLVSLNHTSFEGFPALRWEFTDTEGGIPLHKVDTFFDDANGNGWALLVQTPENAWAWEGGLLESDQRTFRS